MVASRLCDGVQRVARGVEHAGGCKRVLGFEIAVEGVDEEYGGLLAAACGVERRIAACEDGSRRAPG